MSRPRRLLLAGLTAGMLAWAFSSQRSGHPAPPRSAAFTLVGVRPGDVRSLEVGSGATRARLSRQDDTIWRAETGTPPTSASLLSESQDALFPLRAYRRLQVDSSTPELGLGAPQFVVRVSDNTGRDTTVSIGAPNFLGAGFYATRGGDARVYLVSKGTVDVLRSLASGERFQSPRSAKETAVLNQLQQESPEETEPGPWLSQVLEEEGQ